MSGQNVLVCGILRSGTTLTCHLLNKLLDTVALHEPMNVKELAKIDSDSERRARIEQFCAEQRISLHAHKQAKSKHIGGHVPDNPMEQQRVDGALRKDLTSRGKIVIDKPLSSNFMLVVKHNSAFTAMLRGLVGYFPVFAVIRNPLAILASWSSVAINVQAGHAPAAERFDANLKEKIEANADTFDRQLVLLDWFFAQFDRYLSMESIIRYESIVDTGGRVLSVVRPEAVQLDEPLVSQNTSRLYGDSTVLRIGERLVRTDGAWWSYYEKDSVRALLDEISQRQQATNPSSQ